MPRELFCMDGDEDSEFSNSSLIKMVSQSRITQGQLTQLEKQLAPFEDQIIEAAKFVGVELDTIDGLLKDGPKRRKLSGSTRYHGKEEWLLKWLLKRLQAKNDDVPRRTLSTWKLLQHLLETIPRTKSAQILVERQFISILQESLEDIQKNHAAMVTNSELTSGTDKDDKKSSKKRKRSGEVNTSGPPQSAELPTLLNTIYTTMDLVTHATKALSTGSEAGRSASFTAEYMRTVTRTTSEEAAKILGSWLSLCHRGIQVDIKEAQFKIENWLLPFIELWESHIAEDTHLMQFSLNCTRSVLLLLKAVKLGQFPEASIWEIQLEKLVARNIIIPARAMQETDPGLLGTLTRTSIIQDVSNSSVLFDIAIRSIQPHGKRRRPNEEAWLQTAFKTFQDAIPAKNNKQDVEYINAMLQSAIDHKLSLDLSNLRTITAEYGVYEDGEDWHLLATMINLDANVFLILNENENLLERLLKRITMVSLQTSWSQISDQVVLEVLIPLMREFANARDLSGFIHHWFLQLVDFEDLRKQALEDTLEFSPSPFSAWEDEALQIELKKLLEPSLTLQQIEQILDWILPQSAENSNAACLILEAIAGSISHEDVVDAIGVRLAHMLSESLGKLDSRYEFRAWRILYQPLQELLPEGLDQISELWQQRKQPFNRISSFHAVVENGEKRTLATDVRESIEILQFLCAVWTTAEAGSELKTLAKPILLGLFARLAREIIRLPKDLHEIMGVGESMRNSKQDPLRLTNARIKWAFLRCIFEKYPKVLGLGLELEENTFRDMLQSIFWVASAIYPGTPNKIDSSWLGLPHEESVGFCSTLWLTALRQDVILNNEALTELMTEVMLTSQTNIANPLMNAQGNNAFAARALLELPLEVITKPMKEQILKGWLPVTEESESKTRNELSYTSTALDSAVLSLKIKIMRRPLIYEGLEFEEFIRLANSLAEADIDRPWVNLALLKELVNLTLACAHSNIDQSRNKIYVKKAFRIIQKRTNKAREKKKHRLNYALISIFEAALFCFLEKSTDTKFQEIISRADLEETIIGFKECLLAQLKDTLTLSFAEIPDAQDVEQQQQRQHLAILSIIDAFNDLGADASKLAKLEGDARNFVDSVVESEMEIKRRLETFMMLHNLNPTEDLEAYVTTAYGRKSILQTTRTAAADKSNEEKLNMLSSIFESWPVTSTRLDDMLAAKEVIISIEDLQSSNEPPSEQFDLSFVYNLLCGQLWKMSQPQHFFLVSEILDIMLRTKSHSMTQFNIDMTLGAVSIVCSKNGPLLPPDRAGDIYLRLCQLMQAVLNNHRLKLQGHFHLVVQVLVTLVRCLFTPLSHSASDANDRFGAPSVWLSSPKNQLDATHAEAFTRLITLICNPTVSAVRTAKQNALDSATDKAKRMAGQHMKFLLQAYIKLQLEMRMSPEIREKMKPGLYSIFDTTTPESRRGLTDSLDASGRAVYGELYRDYMRFGKWKGN